MKTIYCLLIIFFSPLFAFAQSNDIYENFKKTVADDGWTFSKEKKMFLKQGASDYGIFKLEPGRKYKIFCMSDDADVHDTDVWAYNYENNALLDKDEDSRRMAIVNVDAGDDGMQVKVVGKNSKSDDPDYESRFYILLVYKQVSYPQPSLYDFSTTQKVADFLNSNMISAEINFSKPGYSFSVVGKTDFERSSLQFIVRDYKLYLKMNIPKDGTCDYGLKEIPAEWTGQSGGVRIGEKSFFYLAFKYTHICQGNTYKTVYVTLNKIPESDIDRLKNKIR